MRACLHVCTCRMCSWGLRTLLAGTDIQGQSLEFLLNRGLQSCPLLTSPPPPCTLRNLYGTKTVHLLFPHYCFTFRKHPSSHQSSSISLEWQVGRCPGHYYSSSSQFRVQRLELNFLPSVEKFRVNSILVNKQNFLSLLHFLLSSLFSLYLSPVLSLLGAPGSFTQCEELYSGANQGTNSPGATWQLI